MSDYKIQGFPDYKIQEIPPNSQILAGQRYRKPLYHAAHAALWTGDVYFLVRVALILTAAQQTWRLWTMVLIEWIFARLSRQNQLLTIAAGPTPQSPRKRLRLQGNKDLPRVDVLVPCCGEPLDVILDTVQAACALDYPIAQFRVLVLDDGGSAALRDAIEDLRSQWPQLSYHTRGHHSGKVFAKAGNLNYALFSLQEDFQPEYCAIFDADCLPAPDFLRATLPHLLRNPQAALLTTRQYYYNLPAGDPLSQSRIHFYACHNADLDARAQAIDAGSGAVFRRRVILDVGGYPTFSFSEDWQLSLVLQGLGHQTLQVEEPLQFGLVPSSLQGHIAQRNRWNIGHAQQIRTLRPPTNKSMPRWLQWSIALNGMLIVLGLVGYFVGFLAVPVLLVSSDLIPTTSPLLVKVQVGLAVAYLAVTWLYAYLQMASTGFRVSLFPHLENSWLAGTQLYAIAKFHCFSNKPKGSFVTGSSANSWNRIPPSLYARFFFHNLGMGVILTVCLFFVTVGAFLFSILTAVRMTWDAPDAQESLSRLLTSVAWPPLLHLCCLATTNLWVPVRCLLNPPRYPDRGSMLVRTNTGIRFPKPDVQMEVSCQRYSYPVRVPVVVAALLVILLAAAFL